VRVLSSAKIGTSSWRYYTNSVACAATEYYLGAGEAPGRWTGRGLDALGLAEGGVVSEAQLESLFARALHPATGQRLGRAWRVDGVTGFDLTFSAPKSVSSLWALADPDTAADLRAAHTAAVEAALSYLDRHASWSRRGVDGTAQIASTGLAAACFEHRTSRCADPQLHTHALVVNKVRCDDGIWRTIDATEMYHHKKSAGMIYQAALRSEIHVRTGLLFDAADSNGQAEISAVPTGLLRLWSKRTAQIDVEATKAIAELENSLDRSLSLGERAAVVKTAVIKTRPAKTAHDAGTLQARWYAEATANGFDPRAVVHAVRDVARQAGRQASGQPAQDRDPATAAVREAASTRAVFSRADVAGHVAAQLPVDGRGAAAVLRTVEALADRGLAGVEAVPVGEHPHGRTPRASDERWAGADVLAAEARVLALAEYGRGVGFGRASTSSLVLTLEQAGLDRGQHDAVRALTQNGDFLNVIVAPAGAGKTRTLGVAAEVWRSTGYRVIGLAPSARAAAELSAATGGPAETLAKWIVEQERRGLLTGHARARFVIDRRSVVIVDEASMANTHDLDTLVTAAGRVGAKVVLVGDPAQIGVVRAPGGMLAALANAGHGLELDTVHRFNTNWEADASLRLRRGDQTVLETYRDHGRLHPAVDAPAAVEALHERWAVERTAGREVLMMARTRADVDALNARARDSATDNGEVHGPAVRFGERDWQAGDLLRARRNDRTLAVGSDGHVRNGDRYRVLAVDRAGLHVEHCERGERTFLPGAYVAVHGEYGWATTVTAAQGATVDVGLVLVRPGIDREHL
jgi:conjugative relaxase-like TrwC/TraI family protein